MTTLSPPFEPAQLCHALKEAKVHTPVLKECLGNLSDQLNQRFDNGEDVCLLMQERSQGIDNILLALWSFYGLDECNYTMIAVGGYGRGQLQPCSDIDILILKPDQSQACDALQQFQTGLWD